MVQFRIKTLKPRNPLVLAARQRRAGAHRRSVSGQRQGQQRDLQRELRELQPHRQSP